MARRPTDLTHALIARVHAIPVADDETAQRFLSDEELAPGLARSIADRSDPATPIWVFGYGSLLWQPEFAIAEQRIAILRGYHRRFCLLQRRYRGSPERPGLVLALEHGGQCRGVAFRLDGADPHATLMPVWRREMKGQGYVPRWVEVATAQGPVRALTFLVNRDCDRYTGRLDEPAIADLIATGCGHLGPSAEYLLHTIEALSDLGIRDRHLVALQTLVAERLAVRCDIPAEGLRA